MDSYLAGEEHRTHIPMSWRLRASAAEDLTTFQDERGNFKDVSSSRSRLLRTVSHFPWESVLPTYTLSDSFLSIQSIPGESHGKPFQNGALAPLGHETTHRM